VGVPGASGIREVHVDPTPILASYYPGLGVVAGTAALGLVVALSGTLRRESSQSPAARLR
jgi:hypothetical protein